LTIKEVSDKGMSIIRFQNYFYALILAIEAFDVSFCATRISGSIFYLLPDQWEMEGIIDYL